MTAAGAASVPAPPTSATPRADAVLRSPLATPPGVAAWLRWCERRLAELRASAEDALGRASAAGQPPGISLVTVAAELTRALDDQETGAFTRLLRRPLRQLGPGSPAVATFDRLVDRLSAQVAQAVEVEPLVTRAGARLDALNSQYGARFPTLLRQALDDVGVDRRAIERMRTVSDAETILQRMDAVGRRMDAWEQELANDETWADLARVDGEALTGSELGAIVKRGLRERARRAMVADRARELRMRLAHHAATARAVAGAEPPPDPLVPIVRDLLLTAARLGEVNATGAADAPLWAWTLNGAAPGHLSAWDAGDVAAALIRPAEPPSTAATTLYVVPVTAQPPGPAGRSVRDTLVWITRDTPAAVRVWDAHVALGETIQARVAVPTTTTYDPLLERDLAALFTGADARRSAWYATKTRAHVDVIARHGGAWIARVSRPGVLQRLPDPAWRADAHTAAAFRLLRPVASRSHADVDVEEVQALGPAGGAFGGASTLEVRTALAGDGRAWLRTTALDDATGRLTLERERALFDELTRRPQTASAALVPVTSARCGRVGDPLPLYRRPLVTGPGLGELAPAWLRSVSARLALLAAIARTLVAVHGAGAALGVVHPDAFAYTLVHGTARGALAPRAVLAYAPCATPFGQRHDSAYVRALEARGYGVTFSRLRVSAIPDAVRSGSAATPGDDAASFLRCALDLLALDTLPAAALHDAPNVTATLVAHREHFLAPELVSHVAELLDGGDVDAMVRVLGVVAAGGTSALAPNRAGDP